MGLPVLEIETSWRPLRKSNWPLRVFGSMVAARKPLAARGTKHFCIAVHWTIQFIFCLGEVNIEVDGEEE